MRKLHATIVLAPLALGLLGGCQDLGLGPSARSPSTRVIDAAYEPVFYQGNEVHYDHGRPYYLTSNGPSYIAADDRRYDDYVRHYRIHRRRYDRERASQRLRQRQDVTRVEYGEEWPRIEHEPHSSEH